VTEVIATLSGMAEEQEQAGVVVTEGDGPPEPGMVQCKSPGCYNWFRKQSGRHIYCKLPDCTYKRGAPPVMDLRPPEGAAEELLRRLQEAEEPEAGPMLYVERSRAIQAALRAGDPRATWGALIDGGVVLVAWADRVANGELPAQLPQRSPQAAAEASAQRSPLGLAQVAVASHHRTYVLGERRVEAVYALSEAMKQVASAQFACQQTQGSQAEHDARAALRAAERVQQQAERALQSIEAAWAERGETLNQLTAATTTANGRG
jgi:hypothetical protein